uniref:Aspartyl/asparaginy/proline hydroxylase domain-containing protein n=1 Tax=Phaeomonas parva TaxID=124430 RepID=A0A7S1XNR8_9STRA|mmetsp:Transcript_20874/g.63626  ORF Transcript_20874/g.63626 Transcript_20874/m.63626 type:complete len:302 (+) Transcript_20874:133-1038(+)
MAGGRGAILALLALAAPAADAFAATARRAGRGQMRMSSIGAIQEALFKRYDIDSIARVMDSLDSVSMGKDLAVNHEEHGGARQEAHSYLEGLTAKPWWDTSEFKWCQRLEENADIIAEELRQALSDEGAKKLEAEGTNIWASAVDEGALAYGPDWKTLVLQDREWDPVNCGLFPRTAEILRKITADKSAVVPSVEAFFARQTPGTGIKPHTDFTNFILTAHLGLDTPTGDCWIKVGEEKKNWENGKTILMDTSFIHSTENNTDQDRFVLLLRVWHPEVTKIEREALSFVFRVRRRRGLRRA